MHSALLNWLLDEPGERGVAVADAAGGWERWPYHRLAELTFEVSRGLLAQGVAHGENVVLVLRGGVEFPAALYGVMAIGAVPSPVSPPASFSDRAGYGEHLANVLATSRPTVLVTHEDMIDVLAEALEQAVAADLAPKMLCFTELAAAGQAAGGPPHLADVRPDDLALLTYTSGSSGHCRGVRVPYRALEANVAALQALCEFDQDSGGVSWLPPHHDMGLIGTLIASISSRLPMWLLTPEQFVRDPLRYLRCFDAGATLTGIPTFGLDYIARKVKPADVEGLDLSRVTGVFVGAERVDAAVLERFSTLLAPAGFRREAILPSYGSAEATLAVTALDMHHIWTTISVDPATLQEGRQVAASAVDDPDVDPAWPRLVGCGTPVLGMAVEIIDRETGARLPDGTVGEIVATGTSVALGYAEAAGPASAAEPERGPRSSALSDGRLLSGDAGFIHDGQLYILGRLGDSMKVRGRMLFAEDLEGVLQHAGLPATRVVALLGVLRGRPTAAILLENVRNLTPEQISAMTRELRVRIQDADLVLLQVRTGTIVRTSSGKPKRRRLWRDFAEGRVDGTPLDPA